MTGFTLYARLSAIAAAVAFLISCTPREAFDASSLNYHFDAPAAAWEETFPLGNGRIALMPDGGVDREVFVLNESSVWSGSVQDADNPEALESLPEIRKLLFEGRNDEAQALMYRTFTCGGPGSAGPRYGRYQVLANLVVDYDCEEISFSDYCRELKCFSRARAAASSSSPPFHPPSRPAQSAACVLKAVPKLTSPGATHA